jgi:energy-dependent translational throttle protein EttA
VRARQEGHESASWNGCAERQRRARPRARRALRAFEELSDVEYQKRNETNEIFIPVAERLGTEVIEFKGVSKSFGDRC